MESHQWRWEGCCGAGFGLKFGGEHRGRRKIVYSFLCTLKSVLEFYTFKNSSGA